MIEGDDILGDGVNIAARLEGLCEPGGVLISGTAYDHVRGKIDAHFVDLGEKDRKNVVRPVRVYALNTDSEISPTAPSTFESGRRGSPRLSIVVLPFTGSPRTGYGNVGLFLTLGSHVGLRGLLGGAEVRQTTQFSGLLQSQMETLSRENGQHHRLAARHQNAGCHAEKKPVACANECWFYLIWLSKAACRFRRSMPAFTAKARAVRRLVIT